MIIEIKEDLLTEVARFAWEFERRQETCSFPKYKDFGDLYERFSKSLNDNEDKILAYIEDQELIGVLTLQVKSQDLYLQSLGGIFAKRDFNRVASKFIDYLRDHYLNFELFFGYPIENQVAISYLESIQAELLDACVTMKLQKEDFMSITPHHEVIPLPKERYASMLSSMIHIIQICTGIANEFLNILIYGRFMWVLSRIPLLEVYLLDVIAWNMKFLGFHLIKPIKTKV
ncbi:hypothetical protein HMPREF9402_0128 [Turicibacter sp. HGF1]|uniref:hypothetical protein n=1 Tax=Turicibacter sp. HGF1 TaxID=910310 RepID=UPI0001FD94CB|nr:hypothetical protein [Turicibacter sp. HGF1]EGC92059.1 hypothetical protein HMPREF9402_0128 [Turicibacter sp. HGF1]